MTEMDELLAQLKAEYGQKKTPSSSATPFPEASNHNLDAKSDERIDSLLAELKAELTEEKPKKKDSSPQQSIKTTSISKSSVKRSTSTFNNNLLEDLKGEFQAKEKEEKQRRKQELLEQKQREQEKERRRRQALRQEAQEWLKNLNLNSDEGLWFEEFSYSYDSKIEAAIDYLQAIRESRRLG